VNSLAETIDSALQAAYGFDQDGLEDQWRASNGLPPRQTPQPTEPQSQATAQASGASQSSASQQGGSGVPTGAIIAIAFGAVALAGTVAFAGWAIARRLR